MFFKHATKVIICKIILDMIDKIEISEKHTILEMKGGIEIENCLH